jgi:hypothetical protein
MIILRLKNAQAPNEAETEIGTGFGEDCSHRMVLSL